ncbi:MAG: SDR family NAD(P)-dependent oxidoreductase [Acidobacteriota bacterium]
MSELRLKDKNTIITGAAVGIGASSARLFAAQGAAVVAVDLDEDRVQSVARSIQEQGFRCHALRADVSREEDCRKVIEWSSRELGSLEVLFNNAGVVHQGRLIDASEEDWKQALDVNVKSMFWMCKYAVPLMLRGKAGSIVNMSSVAGVAGILERGVYSVSKAAAVGLTLSLAMDHVKDGIRANCICPATVDTPSLRARIAMAENPEKARVAFLARQPMGRIGTPEEIAALALYLASDESAYMTGQALVVDGGMKL